MPPEHVTMSDSQSSPPSASQGTVVQLRPGSPPPASAPPGPTGARLRIRKLRVLALLASGALLAAVSFVFGMMMAVASDLPSLEDPPVANSELSDFSGRRTLGALTGAEARLYVDTADIAPVMKHAIIAVEDERFYTNEGVDLRGIARALYQDVLAQRAVQGGSTITQQFVKNVTASQGERTLFAKLREAALAFHLTRKWSKERILRNYLNTIYFGNGAYGVESAARTYFGVNHPGCDEEGAQRGCAAQLEAHEAALLAAMVASPSGYDPLANPAAAKRRRDLVLAKMVEQGYLTGAQRADAAAESLPARTDVDPPREDTTNPYFTSWVKQQVVDMLGGGQVGANRAYDGQLKIKTTLDLTLQRAAENAVAQWLPNPAGPRAAIVVLDNRNAAVRAMVGGDDYARSAFNLATQGQRQPGSAFKPFVLAQALREGISPQSVWASRKTTFCVTRRRGRCIEQFEVNNYEDAYAGLTTLARATTFSDNSVYAQVGIQAGTRRIARLARQMGIRTRVSSNPAITLGGLSQGVTPLDMAHAYQTFARDGRLVFGTLSPGAERRGVPVPGPVGVEEIRDADGRLVELPDGERARNRVRTRAVIGKGTADQVEGILGTVVTQGTATRAKLADDEFAAGKTGTTENYGDAWFVGWTRRYTVAVWVGYPDELRPMKTEFRGEPVAGGTYPAGIWKTFMDAAMAIDARRNPRAAEKAKEERAAANASATPAGAADPATPAPSRPSAGDGGQAAPEEETEEEAAPDGGAQAPAQEAPAATATAAPADPGAAATPAPATP
jgi:penicillin-binding protein 1A